MNKFYTENFNISSINACAFIPKSGGKNVHSNRPYHGLVVQLSGRKKYVFANGISLYIQPGDVFYLPKFSDYRILNIELGECIAVNFELNDPEVTYEAFSYHPLQTKRIENEFRNMYDSWILLKNGYLNQCFALLYSIICDIQMNMERKYVPSASKKLVADAVGYIHENTSDCELTIEKISERYKISPEYFRQIFKDVQGISPRKYIIDVRIKKAIELLMSDDFSIGEISILCGYESESYFSREFKRICGYAPTVYKKNMQKRRSTF